MHPIFGVLGLQRKTYTIVGGYFSKIAGYIDNQIKK